MSKQNVISFIAVTGNPTKEQLIKMIKGYKDDGINDVMIYPRTGLEAEYMSEEWHQLVKIFVDFAKENDMRIWLYDELNWPSGTCNNQVYYTDDRFYNKRFFIEDGEVKVYQYGFTFNKDEWPFSGCNNNLRDYYKSHDECYFRKEFDPRTGKELARLDLNEYFDYDDDGNRIKGSGIDLLNPEAMECFLSLTHEKYYKWFGEDFGKIIPGIFTDEPSYNHAIHTRDERTQYCYYDGIIDDYKEQFGGDMIEDMLSYEYHKPDNNFKRNYAILMAKRFKFSFMDTIYNWCDKHNLKYTGHMVKDDSSTESVEYSGNILNTLKGFHIPGVDEIYTRIGYQQVFLGLPTTNGGTSDFLYSQLENERRNGKDEAMVELYALGPYNMSIAQRIRALYYAAGFSINTYFVGMGHLDGKGNFSRSEYFMNASYTCHDHENLRELAAAAHKAIEFANKIPKAQVSVRYPYSAIAENLGRDNIVDYDFLMKDVIELLGKNQYQWHLIADDEKTNTEFTVAFGKNGVINENTGKVYKTAAEWFSDVKAGLSRNITVREMSGVLANNVFVREFTDGSYMVINRADDPGTARNIVVNFNGKKKIVKLLDYGVYTGKAQEKINENCELIPENVEVDMKGQKTLFRANFFGNHSYTFETDKDLTLTMHICTYPERRDVFLDDDIVEYGEKEDLFTDCYNPLYTKSVPVEIKKGMHTLSIHEFDRNFLPMIIFEGDIKAYTDTDDDGVTHDVITISDGFVSPQNDTPFFGTASIKFTVDVPKTSGGASIVLDDFLGMCECIVDGESLGKKATAPYVFSVDKKYVGKTVNCEIVYYSSYGAMFGDIDKFEKIIRTRSDWVRLSPVSSRKETVGLNGLRIFEK